MKLIHSLLFIFLSVFIAACNSRQSSQMTLEEKRLCDSLNIDYDIIRKLRTINTNEIEPFHYSLSKMYENGEETEIEPIRLEGLVIKEDHSRSRKTVYMLKDDFRKMGYSIFVVEYNFNINEKPDYVAILKTTDKYQILQQLGTNGINYDIYTDSVISIIQSFDRKYSLELIGASGDWCEFIIHGNVSDWRQFAEEVYEICPDVVEQGTGSVIELANEMRRDKSLFLWWD